MVNPLEIAEGGTANAVPEVPLVSAINTVEEKEKMHALLEQVDDKYCQQVAEAIGGNADTHQIKEVVAASNAHGHMFHGIKRDADVPEVREHGIKPLTPEGERGGTSYWTSGTELFGKKGKTALVSYDTTFFHYGHSHSTEAKNVMTIAVTNADLLQERANITYPFQQNGYMELNRTVPREAMHLLRVEVEKDPSLSGQENVQRAEQEMLTLIHKAMMEGYEPGKETRIHISLDQGSAIHSE